MQTADNILTVRAYAEAEEAAKAGLSADHIRAFSAATFKFHGYPDAAESDAAVIRYVDTMQEFADPLRHHERESYSEEEGRLVRHVCDRVVDITRSLFGRPVRPWQGPLTTMKVFRAIQDVARISGKRELTVFEIGPGSGYLGALLIAAGHRYLSSDIAQGFYLWQSHLGRMLAGHEFVEGAHEAAAAYPYGTDGRVIHMPWWHYATLYRGSAVPQVDIVVSDHALGEMHAYAMRYSTQLIQMMLSSSPIGLVIFESIGEPRFHSQDAIWSHFGRVGLDRQLADGPIKAIGANKKVSNDLSKAFKSQPPLYNPSGSTKRLLGRDIIPIREEEAPLSYEFYRFMGYDTPRPTQ
jgi:hypothetical protein